jgi:hypothetical protein
MNGKLNDFQFLRCPDCGTPAFKFEGSVSATHLVVICRRCKNEVEFRGVLRVVAKSPVDNSVIAR